MPAFFITLMNTLEQKIEKIIAPSLEGMGFAVVRIKLLEGARRCLQIMAEKADGRPVTLDDCAQISRTVSALLDVADPIPEEYTLEVSSTGIDRPLMKPADYKRFEGHVAKVQMTMPIEGRKRFQGVIAAVNNEAVTIQLSDVPTPFTLPFQQIESAKLVLTDALIKLHQPVTTN